VIEIETKPARVPEPDRPTVCGLVLALSVKVKVPVRAPKAVGVNVTEIVQVAPAANVLGGNGQFDVCTKSPEAEIPEIVSATAWLFFRVMLFALLVVLIT